MHKMVAATIGAVFLVGCGGDAITSSPAGTLGEIALVRSSAQPLPEFSQLSVSMPTRASAQRALGVATRSGPQILASAVANATGNEADGYFYPALADGSPNLSAVTYASVGLPYISGVYVPPPGDAPGAPGNRKFSTSALFTWIGNSIDLNLKLDLTDLQSGTPIQSADKGKGGWHVGYMHAPGTPAIILGPAMETLRTGDLEVVACGIRASAEARMTIKWGVPSPVPNWGGFEWSTSRDAKMQTHSYDVCGGGDTGDGAPSGGGGGTTYVLTICWGYHVYDGDGNYLYSVVEGCTQYQL